MYALGIDIGSATTKLVLLNDKKIAFSHVMYTHPDIRKTTGKILEVIGEKGYKISQMDSVVATGYGRTQVEFATKEITEITCHAKGVNWLFPSARTVIDIGGQDSKGIRIDERGRVNDFLMNDKCAAGTGRFLENMARVLEVNLEEMGPLSLEAEQAVTISSICTVFAETEVISQIAKGSARNEIIAGVHEAIAERVNSMLGRIGVEPQVAMTGGVAKNQGVVKCLEKRVGYPILIPENPQIMGALGAALLGS